jgi:2'-5' RNA ligase
MTQALFPGYPTAMTLWEGWQKEYRYGVLLIYPPEPLRTHVNALRALNDPRSQAYCDAHISMTVAFPCPVEPQDWAEMAHVAGRIAPIPITFGPVRSYPGVPGVVLNIEPVDRLTELLRALESLPVFAQAARRTYRFSPHMTIAEFITMQRTEELLRELSRADELAGTFECRSLAYTVPDEEFHFTERASLLLNG